MEIVGDSLDAVLIRLYEELSDTPSRNKGTRGETVELLGVSLRISKPRARISRSENRGKPFSALGELLWYLSGSDKLEFIQPYVGEYKKDAEEGILYGAYGPRLFAMRGIDQLNSVAVLLTKKPASRRAVVQLFNAEDIAVDHKEIPCTTTLQFFRRDEQLHLSVTLRSNDAYWGLPHDVFCFTMLQEMMARRLGLGLGEYYQYVGSMHVYVDYLDPMKEYLSEGHQKAVGMPCMPAGDPFIIIPQLLEAKDKIRHGETVVVPDLIPNEYWADIVRLVQVFWATDHAGQFDKLKAEFVSPMYRSYLEGRRHLKPRVLEIRRNERC